MKPSRIDLPEIKDAVGIDFGLNETHRYGVELALLEISLWWNSNLGEEEEMKGGGGVGIHDLAPPGTSQTDHSYRVEWRYPREIQESQKLKKHVVNNI